MTRTKIFCDLCGREREKMKVWAFLSYFSIHGVGGDRPPLTSLDICEPCLTNLARDYKAREAEADK